MKITNIFVPRVSKDNGETPTEDTTADVSPEKTLDSQGETPRSAANMSKISVEAESVQSDILSRFSKIEEQSNKDYANTVSKIVEISEKHLDSQNDDKTDIRKIFIVFFACLLSIQMIAVIVFLALCGANGVGFSLSDNMLKIFVTSVFVETLSAIGVMLAFAFASNGEVKVIQLLTAIVNNYQKYRYNDTDSNSSK